MASVTLPDDYRIDAGGGWIATLGTKVRTRGRNWFPVIGFFRPMPEVFAEWLTTEAATDFARGHAFVSSAELIGIPKTYMDDGIEMAAEINNSAPFLAQIKAAELLFNLELPYIDEMNHATFSKILEDNDFRLERFRRALRKLVKSHTMSDASESVDELRDEVAQIRLSDSTFALRKTIAQFGGVFTTFGAGISAVGAAVGRGLTSLDTIGPTIAGAATAGAVAAFVDIWKQCNERVSKRRESKFSLLWDLGVKKPSDLKRQRSIQGQCRAWRFRLAARPGRRRLQYHRQRLQCRREGLRADPRADRRGRRSSRQRCFRR